MAVQVPVNGDHVVLIDEEDADRVLKHRWHVSVSNGKKNRFIQLVVRARIRTGETFRSISLGNFLLDPPKGFEVDHISTNPLDNRRSNLRLATRSQNIANRRKSSMSKSPFKGIYFHKAKKKWHAVAKVQGKAIHLGYFSTPEAAALAYDSCARSIHGEFARFNFPLEGEQHA